MDGNLAWASPATETSKEISLKSAVRTSAKSAYIESAKQVTCVNYKSRKSHPSTTNLRPTLFSVRENERSSEVVTNVPMFRRVKGRRVKIGDTCSFCPADSEKRRIYRSTTIHNRLNLIKIVDKLI